MAYVMALTFMLPAVGSAGAAYEQSKDDILTLTINYVIKDSEGIMIHEPYVADFPYGKDYSVESPAIEKYRLADESQSVISGELKEDTRVDVNYVFETNKADYTIKYIGMTNDGEGVELDTFKGSAEVDDKIPIQLKEFPRWEIDESRLPENEDGSLSITVTSDGAAEATVYYKKVEDPYIIFQTGGSYVKPITAPAGSDITELIKNVPNPTKQGYKFKQWDMELPDKMPAQDLVVNAVWDNGETEYRVARWIQNVNDDNYTLLSVADTRTGLTGSTVSANKEDKEKGETLEISDPLYGFDYAKSDSVTLKPDGSSVLNVYYDREIWTIEIYDIPKPVSSGRFDVKNRSNTVISTITGKYKSALDEDKFNKLVAYYQEAVKNPKDKTEYVFNGMAYNDNNDCMSVIIFDKENSKGSKRIKLYPYMTDKKINVAIDMVYSEEPLPNSSDVYEEHYAMSYGKYNLFLNYSMDRKGMTFAGGKYRYAVDGGSYSGWYNIGDESPINTSTVESSGNYCKFVYAEKLEHESLKLEIRAKRLSYSVKYMVNDKVVNTKQTLYDDYVDLTYVPEEIPSGNKFIGWVLDTASDDVLEEYKMPAGALTLKAKFVQDDVTVTFDSDGGSHVESQTVGYNKPAKQPEDPTKERHMFLGWYTEPNGKGERWTFDRPFDKDTTLYAYWQKSQLVDYTVNYYKQTENGEYELFYTVDGKGIPEKQTLAVALSPQHKEYPTGYYFKPDMLTKTIILQENSENVASFQYDIIGLRDYSVKYVEKDTGKEVSKTKSFNNIPNVYVTENALDIQGYDFIGEQSVIVKELSDSDENEIVFYYRRNGEPLPNHVGNLVVKKTVSGSNAEYDRNFNFRVTLSDTSINGLYGELEFQNGVSEFTLMANEAKTATELPVGIEYEVVELFPNSGGGFAEDNMQVADVPTVLPSFPDEETDKPVTLPSFPDEETDRPVTLPSFPDEETDRPVILPSFPDEENSEDVVSQPSVDEEQVNKSDESSENVAGGGNDNLIPPSSENQEQQPEAVKDSSEQIENIPALLLPRGEQSRVLAEEPSENEQDSPQTLPIFPDEEADRPATLPSFPDEEADRPVTLPSFPDKEQSSSEDDYEEVLPNDGYTVQASSNFRGEITEAGQEVVYNNHRGDEPAPKFGELVVSKTVVSDNESDKQKVFEFKIELDNTDINTQEDDKNSEQVVFTNGVATVKLKHGEQKLISNIPDGTGYKVTEIFGDDFEFDVTSVGEAGIIAEDEQSKAEFTNTRKEKPVTPPDVINPPTNPTNPEPAEPSEPDTDISEPDVPTTGVDPEPEPEVDLVDEDVPLAGIDQDEVDLVDEDVPLAGADPDEEIDLGDDDIPLGGAEPTPVKLDNVPKTGDETNMLNWILLFSVSVLGTGAVLSVLKKNDEKN